MKIVIKGKIDFSNPILYRSIEKSISSIRKDNVSFISVNILDEMLMI
jgi:hypothetical protein